MFSGAHIAIPLCLLSGCASLSPEQRVLEGAYQVAHVVDTAQTFQIAEQPRYHERECAFVLGRHPDRAEVLAWSAAWAAGHYAISYALRDRPWADRLWQVASLVDVSVDVRRNWQIGLHVTNWRTP